MEIVLVATFFFGLAGCDKTFYFLNGFEPLNYDKTLVNDDHQRLKRSVYPSNHSNLNSKSKDHLIIEFESKTHSKKFKLRLERDKSAFSEDHQLDINGKLVENNDIGFLYDGLDLNDKGSYVYGSVIDGVFDGHIYGSKDHFFIEKMSKYNRSTGNDFGLHSILYKDDDINYPKLRVKRAAPSMGTCGLHDSVTDWMNKVQKSVESATEGFRSIKIDLSGEEVQKPWLKYAPRNKRASSPQKDARSGLFTGRTCTMYLQADHKLWEYVFNHEGQRNADRTRNEIFALFNNHIKAVNAIYESTDFGGVRGVNFNVQRTTIWDSSSCPNSDLEDPKKNSFCEENVDVSNFLNLHSIKNHSDFCLAYVLTSRDFVGGTLGLAWVASTTSASSGGLCEPYKWYSEGSKRVRRSLNTGIITLVNYHNRVPMKVSQLTLAHEIGHNFGSPHDFPASCQPGLPEGNFIMFASATSGDKPNNAKFSPCSVANISAVLKEVLAQAPNLDMSGVRRNCLIDPMTSFCGNGVVEDGEQCDCGYDESECEQRQDHCCYARTTRGKLNENRCQRLPNANCSITQGPCCTQQCGFVPSGQLVCRQASDCSKASVCDGQKAACPSPSPRPENTLCQENTKICNAGNCNRSICELVGMEDCFITIGTPEDQCQLSCRNKNDINANCLPSTNIAALRPYFLNKTDVKRGILLRPGSPCNDYRGYCDIFQKCRSVDSNGPLSRLKNLLFNKETLKTVGDWVQENWWIVLIITIVVIFLMAVFIKCCAVHTPSTNPRKPPAQSIYETLRHPTTLLRQGYHRNRRDPSQPPLQPQPQNRQQGHRHHHHHRRQRRSQSGGGGGGPNGALAVPAADHHRRAVGAPDHGRRREQRHRSGAARYSNTPNNELPNGLMPTTVVTVNVAPVAGSSRSSQPLQSASIIVEPPPPYTERGDKPLMVAVPAVAAASGLAAYSGAVSGSTVDGDQAAAAAGARPPARGHRKRKRPRNDDPKSLTRTNSNNEPRRMK